MADMMTMGTEKKYYDKDDFASKGVAGTALGLGIGSLGLQLLNGGLGNFLGGFNNGYNNPYRSPEESFFGIYKGFRDADDAIVAKHNADAFGLYKGQRDNYDELAKAIAEINTKLAVAEATQPWKDKAIYDAIALERERRESADCSIVGYTNCTFIPQYIADITPAATSEQKAVYNPLSCNRCGC